jgi:hypothetical protein
VSEKEAVMNEPATPVPSRTRRPRRRTLLLSATLVASTTTGCPPSNYCNACGVLPPTSPPADRACSEQQKADAGVVKCCVQVSQPDIQRACTAEEQLLPSRCCPE